MTLQTVQLKSRAESVNIKNTDTSPKSSEVRVIPKTTCLGSEINFHLKVGEGCDNSFLILADQKSIGPMCLDE